MAATRKPKSSDSLTARFERVVDRQPGQGNRVTVAFSGGLDSSVVLHLAVGYAFGRDLRLDVLHCHHGLSPNADAWAEHCTEACEQYRLPLRIVRLEITDHLGEGLESAARRERYRVLDSLETDLILLGHHADDQAETLLLNLFRGTGILGLAGIPERKGRYSRPLLGVRRTDIEVYAGMHRLKWCEDESNSDTGYRRNYLRKELIPELEVRYPTIRATLADTAGRCAEAQQLLDDLGQLDTGEVPLVFPYPVINLRKLAPLRGANLLRLLLRQAGLQAPPAPQLEEFLRQVREARPDRHPALSLGPVSLEVRRKYLHLLPPL